jgi:hypothetical protein
MNVRELIDELQKHNPDAEVHVPYGDYDSTEADEVYASTKTYGLLLPEPTVVSTVVIDRSMRGL